MTTDSKAHDNNRNPTQDDNINITDNLGRSGEGGREGREGVREGGCNVDRSMYVQA